VCNELLLDFKDVLSSEMLSAEAVVTCLNVLILLPRKQVLLMFGFEDVDNVNAILTARRDAADDDIMYIVIIIITVFLLSTIIFFGCYVVSNMPPILSLMMMMGRRTINQKLIFHHRAILSHRTKKTYTTHDRLCCT
jgi:hypothetical protein